MQELSVAFEINEDIARQTETLANIREKAYSASASQLTGMPHSSGITNRTELYAVEIADIEADVKRREQDLEKELIKVESFCNTIKDTRLRITFRLRFMHFLTWAEVADMIGPYCSEAAVKTLCYNYLKRSEDT